MSGFAADWLQRREPFDLAARDNTLASRFAAAVDARLHTPRRLIDLAAGSGANFRALAPVLGGDQDWLLVDHDPLLIAAQAAETARWSQRNGWQFEEINGGLLVRSGTARWQVRARQLDLAQQLEELDFSACDGVTTTAFLDLVSGAWLDRLCGVLAHGKRPLLATLTVDGRRTWQPPLPADDRIQEAFQRHQNGDKGFGPALGRLAAAGLADRLTMQGYQVLTARSDWRINAEHPEMLLQMVAESAAVARESAPATSTLMAEWKTTRNAQIQSGLLTLEVGHLDLLAIPTGF